MCGIICLHGQQDPAWIETASKVQFHRGPDASGVFRDAEAQISMAANRLAIIDRENATQPMRSADERYTLVYNGEIYNAPDLRRDLESQGVRFRTDHSDTEVLLVLLMREGLKCLVRLNGMFAFAFYDNVEKTVLCGRDRFGIKPFYYSMQNGRFLCASELKTICAFPFVDRRVNEQSLFHFLSLQYVPGEDTILGGVCRLQPGHALTYQLERHRVEITQWWKVEFAGRQDVSQEDWPELIRESLEKAVARWTLSDVPIAVALSGGLDSSAIVGSLARSGRSVSTFSLGFAGEGEALWNEIPFAGMVAKKWGTQHEEIILRPEDLLADIRKMVWALDEPYGGGLPSWAVFKLMSERYKVALTGTGGDELFGSYGKWSHMEKPLLSRLFPSRYSDVSLRDFESNFVDRFYYFSDGNKRDIIAGDHSVLESTAEYLYRIFSEPHSMNVRDRVVSTDIATQLPEEFLMMTDRFSMAHSVEARTPFLDHEFAALALSIPAGRRTSRRDLKGLLRKAVTPLLPPELLSAPKRGFVIPLTRWIRGPLRSLCLELLDPARLEKQELINPKFSRLYLEPHLAGTADHVNKIWTMLMFQMWHQQYIERVTDLSELAVPS